MSVLTAAPGEIAAGSPQKTPIQELAERSDAGELLGRRVFGAGIDFIVMFILLMIPDGVLGNALYQQTLWIWTGVLALYFVLGEGLWGRSVGKLLMGVVVVDAAGRRPGLLRAVARTVLRVVEVNPLLLCLPAGIALIASMRRQRLGDMLARTYMVRAASLKTLQSGVPPTLPERAGPPVATIVANASPGWMLMRRAAGAVIDVIALIVVCLVIVFLPTLLGNPDLAYPAVVLLFASPVAYYVILEAVWGRTLGKLVAGTIVVDSDGRPPGFARAFIRTGLRVGELKLLGVPAMISFLVTERQQRLGDVLAGTYVVREKDLGRRPNDALVAQPALG
jgi:uncharacterized RDD family membrane protein YckC